jgi:hypothetical protein
LVLLSLVAVAYFYSQRYEELPTSYGRRRGPEYATSVNGTSVLGQMFTKYGHRVTSVSRMSPRLYRAGVIVWAPIDFELPGEDARDFIHDWFANHAGETLVYIGRDYDAAHRYWRDILDDTPEEQRNRVERELAFAESNFLAERAKTPHDFNVEWFETQTDQPPLKVQKLTGPWAENIDAGKTNVELETRLAVPKPSTKPGKPAVVVPPPPPIVVGRKKPFVLPTPAPVPPRESLAMNYEVLLAGDGEPLVTRATFKNGLPGEILIVQNGSFLLNYPLVNHEHRKLAAKLIEHCGESAGEKSEVVFLESTGDPQIVEETPQADSNPFRILTVWPINVLLLQATIVGILYCFSSAPIFGRPRFLLGESLADFGQHVAALGKLLARGKDRNYALQRIQNYRLQVQNSKGHGRLRATDDHGKHAPKT